MVAEVQPSLYRRVGYACHLLYIKQGGFREMISLEDEPVIEHKAGPVDLMI
jgi:hypothetical protein